MSEKPQQKKKIIEIMKSILYGMLQGGIGSGIGLLLSLININAIYGVVGVWLIFGWVTPYITRIRALEILTIIITGSLISLVIYYFSGIQLWFISLIIGISILFWTISLTSKIILFPRKETEETK